MEEVLVERESTDPVICDRRMEWIEECKRIGVSSAKDDSVDVAFDASIFKLGCAPIRHQCNEGWVVARVRFVGMVRRFLSLRDEERMFAHFCDLTADVCTGGAAAYKKNPLNTSMKSE